MKALLAIGPGAQTPAVLTAIRSGLWQDLSADGVKTLGSIGAVEDTSDVVSALLGFEQQRVHHLSGPDPTGDAIEKAFDNIAASAQSPIALSTLLDCLKGCDAGVRTTALWALGSFKSGDQGQTVRATLIEQLKNGDEAVRKSALRTLVAIGPGTQPLAFIATLRELLQSPDDSVRNLAVDGLAEVDTVEQIPLVVSVLLDRLVTLDPRNISFSQSLEPEYVVKALMKIEFERGGGRPRLLSSLITSTTAIPRYTSTPHTRWP